MTTQQVELVATGIAGFDNVLGGGLPAERLYLLQGDPGSGKTTLALQFLMEGRARGEKTLYITLSETAEELTIVANSHGWSLEGISLFELTTADEYLRNEGQNTVFHSAEVELGETIAVILAEVERVQPRRVVFDSLSEMRLLARDRLRYRRQILALKQYFVGRRCTLLLLDDGTADSSDIEVQSLAHGVVTLEHESPEYGAERRRLRVLKLRGIKFRGGYHDFNIETGGIAVYPRLVAAEHHLEYVHELVSSGIPELDSLLDGGISRGTATLIMGPAGAGKSVLATTYAVNAASRGERAAIFSFDENLGTLLARSDKLGLGLSDHMAAENVVVQQVDPSEMSAGEFAYAVRHCVEHSGVRMVIIDSLNGYLTAIQENRFLLLHLHELLAYLAQRGVCTILVMVQHGMMGAMHNQVDVSFLADTVMLLRYFESGGEVRQALSVIKQRTGGHERTIREFRIDARGIRIGPALSDFHGVLSGVPTYVGPPKPLLHKADDRN